MSIELQMLVWSASLLFVLLMYQGGLVPIRHGLKWGLGPRDNAQDPTRMQGRVSRTLANHMEGMMMFAPLILTAHLIDISNTLTVWGSILFLCGRVGFALAYLAGIPILRSAMWAVSIAGLIMIFIALAGHLI